MREVADGGIDRRNAGPAVDQAFTDITARVDAQAQEDGRTARPLVEKGPREIAPGEYRRRKMRRFGDAAFSASAWSGASGTAPSASARTARAGTRAAHIGRALR